MMGHPRLTVSDQWGAAISDFAETMRRDRRTRALADSTLDRICKQVRRFASETGSAPYDVTPRQIADWLDGLNVARNVEYSYRTALRTFYRWAYRVGRVLDDPTTLTDHPLAKHEPVGWSEPLKVFRRWLRASGSSDQTAGTYLLYLRALARETGALDPWQLDEDDLVDWLSRHQWSRETKRSARTAVRSFYRWAATTGRIAENPAERLPVVRPAPATHRPAPEWAYREALAKATPREVVMLRLSAELGLRRGEVAQIHHHDLVLDDAGLWSLTVHGKGDKPRIVPMPDNLAMLLRRQPEGWLFPGNYNGHLSPRYVGTLISRLLPAGVTMHALRHRFATRAYSVNRDVFAVQQLLGHASPATTRRYVQLQDSVMRQLVEAVAE